MPIEASIPLLPARSRPSDLVLGAVLVFRGLRLCGRVPKLRRLTGVSALLTLMVWTALAVGLVLFWPDVFARLSPRPEGGFALVIWGAMALFSGGVVLLIGLSTLPPLLLAPLQDSLSEATEQALGVPAVAGEARGWVKANGVAVGHTLVRVGVYLGGQVALLFLNLVPGLGSFAWTMLATLWTALWVGVEYLDAPMVRHGHPFSHVRAVLRARPWLCLGFGLTVTGLLWIPGLNLVLVPAAGVAGTLLYQALLQARVLGQPSTL